MEASFGWVTITGYAMIQNIAFFFLFLSQGSAKPPIRWILALISLCAGLLLFEQFVRLTIGYERLPHLIFAMSPPALVSDRSAIIWISAGANKGAWPIPLGPASSDPSGSGIALLD